MPIQASMDTSLGAGLKEYGAEPADEGCDGELDGGDGDGLAAVLIVLQDYHLEGVEKAAHQGEHIPDVHIGPGPR